MRTLATLAALLAVALLGGCVHHAHHSGARTRMLDAEHRNGALVVVQHSPRPHLGCWGHRRHWHCPRR
jgi:hypothetical protein